MTDNVNVASTGPFETKRYRGRPKVAEVITNELRADIASGRLPLGSRLPNERDLAAHFGVSQPTIREAIRALDSIGLIEVRHGSGAFVTHDVHDFFTTTLQTFLQIERVGVFDILEVREHLGVYTAEFAAARATPEDIANLREAVKACDTSDTIVGRAEAVASFQIACSIAAHNPLGFAIEAFLVKMLMQIQLVVKGDRGEEFWADQTSHFSSYRARLIQHIEGRNAPGAVLAMRDYLAEQRKWFSADTPMSTANLSDPALQDLNKIVLEIPHYPSRVWR